MEKILFLALLIPYTSFADTIRIDLTGTVSALAGVSINNAERTGGLNSSFINIGDSINYSLTFEETPAPVFGRSATYQNSLSSFAGSVGSYDFFASAGLINIINNGRVRAGPSFDNLDIFMLDDFSRNDISSTSGNAMFNSTDNTITLDPLGAATTAALTEIALNTRSDITLINNTDLFEETVKQALFNTDNVSFRMEFGTLFIVNGTFNNAVVTNVSAVPLPSAAWLLFSGLAGLVGLSFSTRRNHTLKG